MQCVVFCHNVCAGLPCVLQVGVASSEPGATKGDSCLVTVTVPIPLTDLNPLLWSTASSWYMPTNIHYVLHQLMFLLRSDCLYFILTGKEEGEEGKHCLKRIEPIVLMWKKRCSINAVVKCPIRCSVTGLSLHLFNSFVVWGIWLYCKMSKKAKHFR